LQSKQFGIVAELKMSKGSITHIQCKTGSMHHGTGDCSSCHSPAGVSEIVTSLKVVTTKQAHMNSSVGHGKSCVVSGSGSIAALA